MYPFLNNSLSACEHVKVEKPKILIQNMLSVPKYVKTN